MTIKTTSTTAPTRCPSCSSQSRRPQCSRPSAPRGSSPCSARSRNHRRFHLGSETDFISRRYQMKFQGNTIKEIVLLLAKICNCQNFVLWDYFFHAKTPVKLLQTCVTMPLGSINVDSKGSDLSKVGQYCVLDFSNCFVIFKRGQHKHILISTLCQRQISCDFTLWKIYNYKMSQLGVQDIFFHKLTLLNKKN